MWVDTWLKVCEKYAGTSPASSAEKSDMFVLSVSFFAIRYAGITRSDAKIFGIILSAYGVKSAKNARIASNTGLLISVLPPLPSGSCQRSWPCIRLSIDLISRYAVSEV